MQKGFRKISIILLYILLSIYTLISIYPLIWMVFNSFKNNDEIFVTNPFGIPQVLRIENYIKAINSFNMLLYFKNSMIVTFLTVVITVFTALMFSYAVARLDWKLKDVARNFVTSGLFIPVQIILIPLVILVRDLHINNTYFTLVLPYAAFQQAFSCLVFYGFLRSIPFEIEEAAYIDGANIYQIFFKIIIPIAKPAIATVTIFVFLYAWNEFPLALILISRDALKTLPLGLLSFRGEFATNWGGMAAALTIASVPTILIYLFLSDKVEKALTVGSAVKG